MILPTLLAIMSATALTALVLLELAPARRTSAAVARQRVIGVASSTPILSEHKRAYVLVRNFRDQFRAL